MDIQENTAPKALWKRRQWIEVQQQIVLRTLAVAPDSADDRRRYAHLCMEWCSVDMKLNEVSL